MKRKFLSFLLAFAMILTLMPTMAFAASSAGLDNFKQSQTYADGTFTDVKKDDWFNKNVASVYELNIMVGKGNSFFDTESNLTAAEAMTIAARLHSIYFTGSADFVQGAPWYKVYTDYCKENGIADPADFDLNAPVTRGQFADMFSKAFPAEALKRINTVDSNMIPDVKIADKFGAAIYQLYRAGILIGHDKKGTFSSDANIKRVEAAAITTRMAQPALRESIRLARPSYDDSYTPAPVPPTPATPTNFTVSFNMMEHGDQVATRTIPANTKIVEPSTPTDLITGFVFGGWSKTATPTDLWDFENYTVTENMTLCALWTTTSACVAAGTMITMGDGTQKAIEELEIGDVIRTFDHETGQVSSAPVCFIWESKNVGNAFTLTFEDDLKITVIEEHGFYDREENQYAFINAQNANDYIGHHFYDADNDCWRELKSVEVLNGRVDAYAIITSNHLNHLSNGILSICDGSVKVLANIFEYDAQMKFDAEKKADIEKYGLTPKEKIMELEGFLDSDYDDYNLQYLNVAIGKGLTTWEWIKAFSDYCVANGL